MINVFSILENYLIANSEADMKIWDYANAVPISNTGYRIPTDGVLFCGRANSSVSWVEIDGVVIACANIDNVSLGIICPVYTNQVVTFNTVANLVFVPYK